MSQSLDKKFVTALHYLEDVTYIVRGVRSVIKLVSKFTNPDDESDEDEDEDEDEDDDYED